MWPDVSLVQPDLRILWLSVYLEGISWYLFQTIVILSFFLFIYLHLSNWVGVQIVMICFPRKYIPYGERFPDPARLAVVLYFRNPVPHFVANLIPPLPLHPWISEKSFYLRNKWIKSQNMHIIKSCSCLGTMKDKCSLQITKNPLMSLET